MSGMVSELFFQRLPKWTVQDLQVICSSLQTSYSTHYKQVVISWVRVCQPMSVIVSAPQKCKYGLHIMFLHYMQRKWGPNKLFSVTMNKPQSNLILPLLKLSLLVCSCQTVYGFCLLVIAAKSIDHGGSRLSIPIIKVAWLLAKILVVNFFITKLI